MSDLRQTMNALAVERSPEKRLQLLHKMADLYDARAERPTSSEAYLFNDIMEKIVDRFTVDIRSQVASTLALRPNFPSGVARELAEDDHMEVAGPVLQGSPALTEDDLVHLADRGSQAHLAAIAERQWIPERVTDVLINRGNDDVLHAVAANHGARLSEKGMGCMIERASSDADLRTLLVDRPDLTPDAVDRLLPLVSEALVKKLAERGYNVESALSREAAAALRQRFLAALGSRKSNITQVNSLIEEVRYGRSTLDSAIRRTVDSKRLLDVAAIMAAFTRLDRERVFSQLYKGPLQAKLILIRSLKLSWGTAEAIVALSAAKQGAGYKPDPLGRSMYDSIDPSTAQRVLRFLRVSQIASEQSARAPTA